MSEQYNVKTGDTLSKIAKSNDTTIDQIVRDNNLSDPNKIYPKQRLIIEPKVKIRIVDAVSEPIKELECKLTYNGKTLSCMTDSEGWLPEVTTAQPKESVKVEVKKMTGGFKSIMEVLTGERPKYPVIKSPKMRFDSYTTIDHTRNSKMAPKSDGSLSDNEMKLMKKTTVMYNPQGAPVAKVQGVDLEEARVRAFMRMLRVGEGTVGERGYETIFGGQSFREAPYNKDFSDHPNIHMPFGDQTSTAAGGYQVLYKVWKEFEAYRQKYGINDFTPLSQDYFAIVILKHKRSTGWNKLLLGDIENAIQSPYSWEWASLPPGRYGQPNKSMQDDINIYNKYFQEECKGISDLHIEHGFLKGRFK